MDINDVSKIMQVFISQSSSLSGDDDSSFAFSLLLESLLENLQNSGNTSGLSSLLNGWSYSSPDDDSVISDNSFTEDNDPESISSAIEKVSSKYGMDADFIKSIIKQESGFNPAAVSGAGALGLMQLMPSTAKSLGVDNPFDILENIDGGTRYIRSLINKFNGNKELALAAYNGGSGRMKKLGVDTVSEIDKMPKETQNYVTKVIKNYEKYSKGNLK